VSTLSKVVVAVRARLEPATYNPNAKYVLAMAADRWGANGQNGWDGMIGRVKKIDANWRVYTATLGDGSGFPGLTGVQSPSEYR
jgi:hypothetical protein